jgi:hypothetical protein
LPSIWVCNFVIFSSVEKLEKMELDVNSLCSALNILVKPADKGVYKETLATVLVVVCVFPVVCRKTMVWTTQTQIQIQLVKCVVYRMLIHVEFDGKAYCGMVSLLYGIIYSKE